MKKYVAYYRVSTTEQGRSGLGLDAQKATVLNYVKGNGHLVAEYTEIETGTSKRVRIELDHALTTAKKEKAVLVIAKLDRLSRNVHFISSLMEADVEFVACDAPLANNFTLHIFSALAEQEARLISERTKAALGALKERGKLLGTPSNLCAKARAKGLQKRVENAHQHPNNLKAKAMAVLLREKGLGYSNIAQRLNDLGYGTRRNCSYRAETVKRLIG